jgi:hypothetical protein
LQGLIERGDRSLLHFLVQSVAAVNPYDGRLITESVGVPVSKSNKLVQQPTRTLAANECSSPFPPIGGSVFGCVRSEFFCRDFAEIHIETCMT